MVLLVMVSLKLGSRAKPRPPGCFRRRTNTDTIYRVVSPAPGSLPARYPGGKFGNWPRNYDGRKAPPDLAVAGFLGKASNWHSPACKALRQPFDRP
jgi:hypothetical protein